MPDARSEQAEGYAHSTVPAEATGSALKVYLIVAGSLCGLPVFVLSSDVTAGLGFRGALAVFAVGALVSGLLGAGSALAGARTRMTLALLAETTFGGWGAQLVKLVIAVALIGWFGVIVSVLGATASAAMLKAFGLHVPTPVISVPLCVLIALVAYRGITGLERLGAAIIPLTFLLLLVAVLQTTARFSAAVLDGGSGALDFGAGVSAVVGAYIVGIIIQPDYARFVRHPARAAGAAFGALGLTFPLILGLSAVPSVALGQPDLIAALIVLGIGLPAVALLLMGAWIDASACLYSGSLALAKLIPSARLVYIVAGSALVGMLLALGHAERHFMPFLQLLGVALPPVAAVQCITALWPGRGDGACTPATVGRLHMAALAAWGIGVAAGVATNAGVSITGIAALDSVLGAGVATAVLRVLVLRRTQ